LQIGKRLFARSARLSGISDGLKALWILGRNDDNKKLQFEVSSRVVHKRSISQNMPIWEHKRNDLVILSYMKCT